MATRRRLYEKLSFDWTSDSIRHFVSPTALSRALPFHIQEVGDFKTFPPYYTERRNLESYQLIYTLKGQGQLNYRGESYVITPGQLFLLDCVVHHVYFTPPDHIWNFLWIHYYGPAAKPFYEMLTADGFFIQTTNNAFQIETMMRRVLAVNQKKSIGYEAISSQLIHTLLTEILIEHRSGGEERLRLDQDIERVIDYIEAHLQEKLTLDRLALAHDVSKYHLARKFKQNTRLTINEYIISARLNKAKELLRTTNLPINEITLACGINSPSHFIQLFRAREGMTPLAYRRMWLSGPRKDYGYAKFFGN